MSKRNGKLTHNTLQWIMDWADHCKMDDNYNWTKHDENVYKIVKNKQSEWNSERTKKYRTNH